MYHAGQELKMLDPKDLTLYKEAQKTEGLCVVVNEGSSTVETEYTDVTVHQMFPLSHPDNLITLCDKHGNELGVLMDPLELDEDSRQTLLHELELSYFVPKIERIISIKEEYGVIRWVVETDRGERSFEVQSRHDIRPMGNRRFIVRDMDGNRYDIQDMAALDQESKSYLELEV